MRNHCNRPKRDADCRYTFQPDMYGDEYNDYCNRDDYYYYDDDFRCRPEPFFVRWFGFSQGSQNLNCSNGYKVKFNHYHTESENSFRLSPDKRRITICESGVYRIRYDILVPPRASGNVEFFVAQNNTPIPSTRIFIRNDACGRTYTAEGVVRVRMGTRLSLQSSDEYCAKAPNTCMTMASMSIEKLR